MDEDRIHKRFEALKAHLDERARRLWAAAEASVMGRGGISKVSRATGVSRQAIALGCQELQQPVAPHAQAHIRKEGGGRKRSTNVDPTLLADLESLIEPTMRGDPESPLRWTCKSLRQLAAELQTMGHTISHQTVASLLHTLGYSLQANRKTREGDDHPDRNAQFERIHEKVMQWQSSGQPVISVDTKKKELIGDFKNAGQEWRPQGQPQEVRVHDFLIPDLGRASPYGVYDITQNTGWVNVGIDHDTASFAVESIRRWWESMGRAAYPHADRLLITADGGGSNGYRVRLWKLELQHLADETNLCISVCHLPPGTSKWNRIEHRLFSHISRNWRGQPLISHEVIVNLIAGTRTATGLRVACALDTSVYPSGVKVSDEEMATVHLERAAFHGEWNYTIVPTARLNDRVIL